jgi:hypothetical protein
MAPRPKTSLRFGAIAFGHDGLDLVGSGAYWWSMIFSENRYPLFGIML